MSAEQMIDAINILTTTMTAFVNMQAGVGVKTKGEAKWDQTDRYRNVKCFGGKKDEWEEWSVKVMSQVGAGCPKARLLMKQVAEKLTEAKMELNDWSEMDAVLFDDAEWIEETSDKLFNLLLSLTIGEANAVVRRSNSNGLLAWKRLSTSLNPRTLASGVRAIAEAITPDKIQHATKADASIEKWEDAMIKLQSEYGESLSAKLKVAILYSMLPRDLQEKVLDECSVKWEGADEKKAAEIYLKVKESVKNIAKSRRDMSGPKPMDIGQVQKARWCDWEDWDNLGYDLWFDQGAKDEIAETDDKGDGTAEINYVGNKGGKGGKGYFAGNCFGCGEFGHSQRNCPNGKAKGKGYKGYNKGGDYKGYKGYGSKGYKGYGDFKGFGKGDSEGTGKGGWQQPSRRACFQCGSTEHLIKDCPNLNNNPAKVNQVAAEQDEREVLFIGHVDGKATLVSKHDGCCRPCGEAFVKKCPKFASVKSKPWCSNRFEALSVDEYDEEGYEVMHIQTVQHIRAGQNLSFADPMDTKKVIKVKGDDWLDLGSGDLVVDSAADESCWPQGVGDAFATKPSSKKILLRTANGGDMGHYGEKQILFQCGSSGPLGLTFQVTDVRKPLLSVRRLVEKGNHVVLTEAESYVYNPDSKVKIPIVKKGGSFVIEAKFVKPAVSGFARQV